MGQPSLHPQMQQRKHQKHPQFASQARKLQAMRVISVIQEFRRFLQTWLGISNRSGKKNEVEDVQLSPLSACCLSALARPDGTSLTPTATFVVTALMAPAI